MATPFVLHKNRAILAPMAGVADHALRVLCMQAGAQFCCAEMASAMGLATGDAKSAALLQLSPAEHPAGVQLFGKDPQALAKAAEAALRYAPRFIDLNMGCPAHKVAGHGSGAALMKNLPLAAAIVQAVVQAVAGTVPVSVKMRTGWDATTCNATELARICEQSGAAWVTVHGRTRAQMYAPPIDYESIRAVKAAVQIPVIANGDIRTGPIAQAMLERTGCDAIMVGRAALGAPWVFTHIAAYLTHGQSLAEPSPHQKMQTMLQHVALLCEQKGSKIGMREARKHAAWYTKGMRGSAQLRQQMVHVEHYEQLQAIAQQICACTQLDTPGPTVLY